MTNEPPHGKTNNLHRQKTKTQISFAVTAKLISAFVFATRIEQFLFYLNPKFQASSSFLCLHRPVYVGPVQKPHCWFSHEAAQIIIVIIVISQHQTVPIIRYINKDYDFIINYKVVMILQYSVAMVTHNNYGDPQQTTSLSGLKDKTGARWHRFQSNGTCK